MYATNAAYFFLFMTDMPDRLYKLDADLTCHMGTHDVKSINKQGCFIACDCIKSRGKVEGNGKVCNELMDRF